MAERAPLDLGHGVTFNFTSWGSYDKAGFIEEHQNQQGEWCGGGGLFDLPGLREAFPDRTFWTVESWEPLTLSPSLLCRRCGNHGFIRDGQWVPA